MSQAVSQPVSDKNRLQIDVPFLIRKDLRGEDGDIVTGIGLACDVEILVSVLGKLCEKEGEESVDVLSSGNGVGDGGTAVGKADIDGLVQENDAGVGVPAVGVGYNFEITVDGRRAEFEEKASKGGAAWAAIKPKDHWVVLRIVA